MKKFAQSCMIRHQTVFYTAYSEAYFVSFSYLRHHIRLHRAQPCASVNLKSHWLNEAAKFSSVAHIEPKVE